MMCWNPILSSTACPDTSGRKSRPVYFTQGHFWGPGYHGSPRPPPAKSQEHACLGKSILDAVLSLLISLFFGGNLPNDELGGFRNKPAHSLISWYSFSQMASCLFTFYDPGAREEWAAEQTAACRGQSPSPRSERALPCQRGRRRKGAHSPRCLMPHMWSANGPAWSWNVKH